METINTVKAKLAMEKLNRAQSAMDYTPIVTNDDSRNQLTAEYNAQMAALTPAERDALLEEWGY